ncbi:MAG TPA: tetratricopeptide repeat protein [Pirellulales bacterium]|jgi:tetratricopeptide (TPR) repeat protein
MDRRQFVGATILVILSVGIPAPAAQPAKSWLGRRVLPKERCEISANGVVVNFRSLTFPLVVQSVNGPWLWVGDDKKGWVKSSQVVTLDEAVAYYTRLIARRSDNAWAYNFRAVAWQEQGQLDRAIADFSEKLRLVPTADSYANRGAVWQAKGEYHKAIDDYDRALGVNPNFHIAFAKRGDTWRAQDEYQKAIDDYNEAIRLDPNDSAAHDGLALLRASSPDEKYRDGAAAVRLATTACELSGWTVADKLATLAAAYAECGDFDQAVKYQQKAIDRQGDDADATSEARRRLQLYTEKQPFRATAK